jgi:F0F1-type ATP synthase membrane subunit a
MVFSATKQKGIVLSVLVCVYLCIYGIEMIGFGKWVAISKNKNCLCCVICS